MDLLTAEKWANHTWATYHSVGCTLEWLTNIVVHQLSANWASNREPNNTLWHNWLVPITSHFQN